MASEIITFKKKKIQKNIRGVLYIWTSVNVSLSNTLDISENILHKVVDLLQNILQIVAQKSSILANYYYYSLFYKNYFLQSGIICLLLKSS